MARWGIVTTLKAPLDTTLRFLAYHLDMGAARVFVYVDDCDPATLEALQDHPRVTVCACDEGHWRFLNGRRPMKHQMRQMLNATHAYGLASDLDWIAHIDVDEFLWPDRDLAPALDRVPQDVPVARVLPAEALANDGVADAEPGQIWFKTSMPRDGQRLARTVDIYPTFGTMLDSGFLSHRAGKVIVRTGLPDIKIRIHKVFQNDQAIGRESVLPDTDLCHIHADSWDAWQKAYRYRLEHGSYRADLDPKNLKPGGRMGRHTLFSLLEAEEGEAGLRDFFDEVCRATPALRAKLAQHNLLSARRLELDLKLAKHFPDFT